MVHNPGHLESGFTKLTVNGVQVEDNYIPVKLLTEQTEIEMYIS